MPPRPRAKLQSSTLGGIQGCPQTSPNSPNYHQAFTRQSAQRTVALGGISPTTIESRPENELTIETGDSKPRNLQAQPYNYFFLRMTLPPALKAGIDE